MMLSRNRMEVASLQTTPVDPGVDPVTNSGSWI